ncbi:sigma-70 family RNA polymerase sigma factor [Pseudonocardia lacus]|uniref:sigma-70 family RNA polymerase sigma factor n=1 Tax=Pseudonocardia lacus TaxID=2835865 RepID=UPI0027E327FB|nr:sigma-70 family RNA polymerase sigma factor [Pseudonocardia lacus]
MSPPSFEAFVLATGPELVVFARRLTLDHHRAEDIVQDVLARLGLSWSRLGAVADLRAYAYKAVLNDFLSWRRRLSSGERPWADPGARLRAAAPAADERIADRDQLREVLAVLPPVQRAVLVLRYYHDRPDSEIADLLGCREATVRSHAHRALAALRAARPTDRANEGSSR